MLLLTWVAMCWACGAVVFFSVYLLSVSIAGGAGIVLFTVQHNFEHAYANSSERWDYETGAIEGTSYLVLPGWLNWFTANTANIGYHIHHLSANIPNYRLVACHLEYEHLFTRVTRVKLSQVYGALQCILWDRHARRIISLAEYGADHCVARRPGRRRLLQPGCGSVPGIRPGLRCSLTRSGTVHA